MTRHARIIVQRPASVLAALLAGAPAQSQTATAVGNERILIEYMEPRHPIFAYYTDADDPAQAEEVQTNIKTYKRYMAIMERLKARQVMEEFSQFLAPLKLPITLRLRTMQCGEVNAFYDPADSSINLCYEFVADIEDRAPRATTPEGITRDEVIVGQIVGTLLHEGGHAISNLLRLPVLGREEDTADQIAAFVMLQFGRDIARTLIKGETFGWNQRQRTASRFWGPHSTALAAPAHVPLPRLRQRPAGVRGFRHQVPLAAEGARRQLRQRVPADPARLPRDHRAASRHGAGQADARDAAVDACPD